jgi:hypothetical protein
MSTFKTVAEAVVSFTAGKTDKASLLNYAKTLGMVDVLTLVGAKCLTPDEASPLLTPKAAPRGLHFKVSEKGGLSVYGLQSRFPVTLYRDQWERLLAQREEMEKFIADNAGKLSVKPAKS